VPLLDRRGLIAIEYAADRIVFRPLVDGLTAANLAGLLVPRDDADGRTPVLLVDGAAVPLPHRVVRDAQRGSFVEIL
jgi:hypothetical protein